MRTYEPEGREFESPRARHLSRTTGGPAEVLRKGSGIKVYGTAGHGLTISTCIKGAGNLHWQKPCRASFIINVRRAMSSGSGQRPERVSCPYARRCCSADNPVLILNPCTDDTWSSGLVGCSRWAILLHMSLVNGTRTPAR